jgi:hypothetical protein
MKMEKTDLEFLLEWDCFCLVFGVDWKLGAKQIQHQIEENHGPHPVPLATNKESNQSPHKPLQQEYFLLSK